eukprot:gene3923-13997_t
MDFFIGAAIITAPKKGIPLAVATAAGRWTARGIKKLLNRRKQSSQAAAVKSENPDAAAAAAAAEAESADKCSEMERIKCKVDPVYLEWTDVQCSLEVLKKGSKEKENRPLLKEGISGVAKPGRLMAILGPSGSGKTTLLNALAGQVAKNKKMSLKGNVTINGVCSSSSKHKQAYVQQEDIFYSMLTVAETLNIAIKLRLPSHLTPHERKEEEVTTTDTNQQPTNNQLPQIFSTPEADGLETPNIATIAPDRPLDPLMRERSSQHLPN